MNRRKRDYETDFTTSRYVNRQLAARENQNKLFSRLRTSILVPFLFQFLFQRINRKTFSLNTARYIQFELDHHHERHAQSNRLSDK
jgi:uncharacterized membrane protein